MKLKPEDIMIGMGATRCVGSDRYPATVVEMETIKGQLYITVQEDNYKRVDSNGPFTESQDYEFSPNPNGTKHVLRFNKDSKWEQVRKNTETGRWNKVKNYSGIHIGQRDAYYDPCF